MRKYLLSVIALTATLTGAAAGAQYASSGDALPYRVECGPRDIDAAAICRTDLATYIGRRVFEQHCASCHAADATGSSFAPALPERVRRLSRAAFLDLLEDGYRGEAASLPRWAEVPEVDRYAEPLWLYLLARANGDLPPGPIDLLPDAGRP